MKTISVYVYDETCGICNRVMSLLKPLVSKKVIFTYACEMNFEPNSEPMKDRYYNIYSYDGSNFYKGYQTYVEITRRSFILYPLHLLMRVFY